MRIPSTIFEYNMHTLISLLYFLPTKVCIKAFDRDQSVINHTVDPNTDRKNEGNISEN